MGLNLYKLYYDATDGGNEVGSHMLAGTDGTPIGAVGDALKVDIGSVSDLDIRDLVFATDKVDVSGSDITATVSAVNLDIRDLAFATDKVDVSGSNIDVSATDLDIRDLAFATDSVTAHQGGTWTVDSITNDVNVTATDLDIRDLSAAQDSVASWTNDGSGNAISSTAGSLHVSVTDGVNVEVDLDHADDSVRLGDGTTLTDVTSQGELFVSDSARSAIKVSAESITAVAAEIVATPLANRSEITFQNIGSKACAIGPAGVTFATGMILEKGDSATFKWSDGVDIYAICDTGNTCELRVLESA